MKHNPTWLHRSMCTQCNICIIQLTVNNVIVTILSYLSIEQPSSKHKSEGTLFMLYRTEKSMYAIP